MLTYDACGLGGDDMVIDRGMTGGAFNDDEVSAAGATRRSSNLGNGMFDAAIGLCASGGSYNTGRAALAIGTLSGVSYSALSSSLELLITPPEVDLDVRGWA